MNIKEALNFKCFSQKHMGKMSWPWYLLTFSFFFLKILYNICLRFLFILILGDSLVLPEEITFTKERFLNVKNIMTKGNTPMLSVIQSSSIRRLLGGLVQSTALSQALILASRCSDKYIFQCGLHCITCPWSFGLPPNSGCRKDLGLLCLLEGSCRLGWKDKWEEESHRGDRDSEACCQTHFGSWFQRAWPVITEICCLRAYIRQGVLN